MNKLLLSFILITSSHALFAGTIVYVNASGGCDHTSLQAAINDLTADEIRIVGSVQENLLINRSINIKGGYASCGANQPTSISAIDGDGNNSLLATIRIKEDTAFDTPNNVILQNLTILNGAGGYTGFEADGGGISIAGGLQTVTVSNSTIFNNDSLNAGGGISVRDGATLNIVDSGVLQNTALNKGGGIYCRDSNILVIDSSAIVKNEVDGNDSVGGGVYLEACDLDFQANQAFTFFGTDYYGISENKAKTNGAGIYAIGIITPYPYRHKKSTVSLGSANHNPSTPPVLINNNEVTGAVLGNASAVWLNTDTNSCGYFENHSSCSDYNLMEAQNVHIDNNFGAKHLIFIGVQSKLNIHCDNYTVKLCNQLSNNSAESLITYSSHTPSTFENLVDIKHQLFGTEIYDNSVNRVIWGIQKLVFYSSNHPVYENSNWQSSLTMGRSIIHHNGPLNEVALAIERTNMHFNHVTIADNTYAASGASVFENALSTNPNEIPTKVNSLFETTSSIISEPNVAVFNSGFDNIDFSCVLYSFGVFGFVNNTDGQFTNSPGFVNAASGDYHLLQNSPAVDSCDDRGNQTLVNATDIDGEAVGWDDSNTVDNLGPYDRGADELHYTIAGNTADLGFTISTSPSGPYIEGQVLTFTHVISNNGPDAANNVNVGYFPNNMQMVSWNSTGLCTTPSCIGLNLPNGHTEILVIKAKVLNAGSFQHYLQMFGNESDPNAPNNFSSLNGTAAVNPDIIFKNGFE